jgi:hypothetical protein
LGIGLIWQNNVWISLQDIEVTATPLSHEKYDLVFCNDRLIINLIPLINDFNAQELIELQAAYHVNGITLLQVWEDVWYSRREQVMGRIKSILGLNERMHGRKGVITTINQKQADDFLNENHIQASAKSKYKLALEIDRQIIAVACFSQVRLMKRISENYRSVELIRFATLKGITVTGGFTKLLKHLIKMIVPDDVMSYADRDWSLGSAYEQSGFQLVDVTPPSQIWVKKKDMTRFFPHRLSGLNSPHLETDVTAQEAAENEEYTPVFNTGNLKYILYLNNIANEA